MKIRLSAVPAVGTALLGVVPLVAAPSAQATPDDGVVAHKVVYSVDGPSESVELLYSVDKDDPDVFGPNPTRKDQVELPWSKSFTLHETGGKIVRLSNPNIRPLYPLHFLDFLLSVRADRQEVHCTISLDGKIIWEKRSYWCMAQLHGQKETDPDKPQSWIDSDHNVLDW